jgi:hypothetical protein
VTVEHLEIKKDFIFCAIFSAPVVVNKQFLDFHNLHVSEQGEISKNVCMLS